MSMDTARIGTWAAALPLAEVPPDVRRLARLQHLAGAVSHRGDGGTLDAGDPFVLAGRTSRQTLPWLWAHPPRTVGELVTATVAGNEVGGRIGLARLLDARGVTHDPIVSEAARQAAMRRLGDAAPILAGDDVVVPLPGALGGLGTVWLTRTLVVPRFVAPPWCTVALEGLDEILRRHVKAAEKRLRADQVERIEVKLPWLHWGHEQAPGTDALAHLMGVLLSFYGLGPEELADPAVRAEEVAWVTGTVIVTHDWAASLRMVEATARGLRPLLGGFGFGDYRAVRAATKAKGGWPGWTGSDLLALLRAHPEKAWAAVRGARGDLAQADVRNFVWTFPVEIKLYTSRGGWWPERRSAPVGTGDRLEGVVRARTPGNVDAVLALPDDAPATDLVGLLGIG